MPQIHCTSFRCTLCTSRRTNRRAGCCALALLRISCLLTADSAARQDLAQERIVVTRNGQPAAMLIKLAGWSLEETPALLADSEACGTFGSVAAS